MIKKLKNHKSAQCHIVNYKDEEIFVSYTTNILITNLKTNIMEVTGLYSATTRRQISWYLQENFPHIDYYTIKEAYYQDKKVNTITGDLI